MFFPGERFLRFGFLSFFIVESFFEKSVSKWEAFLLVWNVLFFVFIYLYYFSSFVFLGLNDFDLYILAFLGFAPLYIGFSENLRIGFPVFFLIASLASFSLSSFFDFIFFVYFIFSLLSYGFYEKFWKEGEENRIAMEQREREQREYERVAAQEKWAAGERERIRREVEREYAQRSSRFSSRVREEVVEGVYKNEGDRARRENRILTNIRRSGWVNVKGVMGFNEVSKRTAVYDLNSLIRRGLIERKGKTNSTIYVFSGSEL